MYPERKRICLLGISVLQKTINKWSQNKKLRFVVEKEKKCALCKDKLRHVSEYHRQMNNKRLKRHYFEIIFWNSTKISYRTR